MRTHENTVHFLGTRLHSTDPMMALLISHKTSASPEPRLCQAYAKLHVSQSIMLGTTRVQDPAFATKQDCKEMQRSSTMEINGGICEEFKGGLTSLNSPYTMHGRTAEHCIISRCRRNRNDTLPNNEVRNLLWNFDFYDVPR